MSHQFDFKKKVIAQLIMGGLLATGVNASFAQTAIDLGTVQSSAGGSGISKEAAKETASYQAPTQGSLISTQPQSIISEQFIQHNASATSNFADIVNIAPAVSSVDPNGPGLMESQSLTMRGFEDGQFNVTFDGIPWQDSNDFTHHSTSYLMAHDLGGIVVDRGPGDASTIGITTFGGSMAVKSKNPSTEAAFTAYTTLGSFNTRLAGMEFDTGVMKNYGDASAFIDYEKLTSDGFLTNNNLQRDNLFAKFVKPVSDNTSLTFVAMHNNLHQNTSANNGGVSLAYMQKYGYNAGLINDPTSQSNAGYNYDDIRADMEYVDITTQQGDWKIDNKVYTYAYYHNGFQGANVGGTNQVSPNLLISNFNPANSTTPGTAYGATDVPGSPIVQNYRSWGDTLKTSTPMGSGKVDLGIWFDHQSNFRAAWSSDMTLNGALDPNGGGYGRLINDTLTTIQPYGQYEWKLNDALTVTPGLKYSNFSRSFNAPIMQGWGGLPYNGSSTFSKVLPSLDAHYMVRPNWSAYAQYAQGFEAPIMQAFQKPNVDTSTIKPTQTDNYQVGTTWKDERLTVSGDVYEIVSKNWMQGIGTQNGVYVYGDAGNVNFNGAEGEVTYNVGSGFSFYGNDAIINYDIKNPTAFANAKVGGNSYQNGSALNNVPRNTMTAGVIYNQGPVYASLLAKETGARTSGADAQGNPLHFGAYTITNFNSSYALNELGGWGKKASIGFQVNNLFNKQGLYASNGNDINTNDPLFFVIPTRSYQLSLSLSL